MKRFFAFMFTVGLMTIGLNTQSHAASLQATVYKDPNCGCCAVYADYLIRRDVEVEVIESDQVVQMSRMTGIPEDMQGCHLTMIDGYAISGHVPFETIERILAERPEAKAYTLPGMPMGSPGMGGVKNAPFQTYQIHDGAAEIYDVR
ncbi:MAG TPA: metal-binding protein [Thalassospira sp.]|nr:metal-binding protein [Thalassospira sp.]|tara:strand:+ start:2182 stop:2622 length:441 start_codon:yes stop_codon:yes gene_type:complete